MLWTANISLYLHVAESRERKEALVSLFCRALTPLVRDQPSWPLYCPKALLVNTVTLRVRISTYGFGGTQTFSS